MMPVALYPAIQREFWLPFTVLFFALVSHLVPSRNRRGVLIITVVLVVVVVQQTFWHLGKPHIYDYEGDLVDGVCQQTSFETCGAASMVTMLHRMGVKSTEGEMARLSMTAPGMGLSPHQAAYGLQRKLEQLRRPDQIALRIPKLSQLHQLPTPFLAGIRFSFWTNHLICVLETTPESLVVGDPISSGPKTWSWQQFEQKWSGVVVVLR